MRLSNTQAVSRPEPSDRNGTAQTIVYGANSVAPHAQTTRASYTVPANRKAVVEASFVQMIRDSAAAAASIVQASFYYTKSGGSAQQVINAFSGSNVLWSGDHFGIGWSLRLFAGDVIDLRTSDVSTGGTNTFNLFARATEYDS